MNEADSLLDELVAGSQATSCGTRLQRILINSASGNRKISRLQCELTMAVFGGAEFGYFGNETQNHVGDD